MSDHIPNDMLLAFTNGDLDDSTAVTCAEHIDECHHCAARAATMEPLAMAFASVQDPEVPADLVPAVLRALEAPQTGIRQVVMGSAMLTGALGLSVTGRDPLSLLADISSVGKALQVVASNVGQLSSSSAVAAAVVSLALGALATWLVTPSHHRGTL